MQRLILIILSSFFLLISCRKSAPEGILSEKKMVDLMVDVNILDGYLNMLPIDSSRKLLDGMYGRLFENHAIDSTTFKENLQFYLGNPTLSKQIYAQVNDRLKSMDNDFRRVDSLKNTHLTDSIRRVQHYSRLRDEAQQLILNGRQDTVPLTYNDYRTVFMRNAGLQFMLHNPASGTSVTIQEPAPSSATASPQQPVAPPEGAGEQRQLPRPNPSVEQPRLKPVKELQRLP